MFLLIERSLQSIIIFEDSQNQLIIEANQKEVLIQKKVQFIWRTSEVGKQVFTKLRERVHCILDFVL